MHPAHPDKSPIAAAILKVLANADAPLSDLALMGELYELIPGVHYSQVNYYLTLLVNAERVGIVTYEKKLGDRVVGISALYEIKDPLDGLAAL